ncbi:MAG: hypothetical protein NZ530_06900 [Thermodesulfobacteriaceae bacterium]|nr:hypothetical protein [Thermodesulfobacteriaceae bacterium]MDW8136394.1 hypothetical protein [Thermodesulfobacterium sp.]
MDTRKVKFPKRVSEEEREEVLSYLEERFGIEKFHWRSYEILKGSLNYWLFPKNPYLELLANLQVQTVGLLFLRRVSKYLKPTSAFLQRFGYLANKNIVELTSEEIKILKEKQKIKKDLSLEPGYIILKKGDLILGCGLWVSGNIIAYLETKVLKNI